MVQQRNITAITPKRELTATVNHFFKNIKTFEGLDSDFNTWVDELDRIAEARGYNDVAKYYLAVDNIGEAIKPIAASYEKEKQSEGRSVSWNRFKEKLGQIYAIHDKEKFYREKLMKIRLSQFTKVSKFNDEFIKILSSIGWTKMKEDDIMMCYMASVDVTNLNRQLKQARLEKIWDAIGFTNREFTHIEQDKRVNYARREIYRYNEDTRTVRFDNNRRQSFDASKQNADHRIVVFNNDNREQRYQRQHSGERKVFIQRDKPTEGDKRKFETRETSRERERKEIICEKKRLVSTNRSIRFACLRRNSVCGCCRISLFSCPRCICLFLFSHNLLVCLAQYA
jgi:hypothetical protein